MPRVLVLITGRRVGHSRIPEPVLDTNTNNHYYEHQEITMRVKKSVADVWWQSFGWLWITVGRCENGMEPLFDNKGYHFTQAQYIDPRKG